VKVSYLHIRNYKQFSELELDLTYPKGHTKEGMPLDKICIIGQSGTGKTNLLDIIKKSTIDFSEQPENSYLPFTEFVGKDTDDRYITTRFDTEAGYMVETLFTKESSKLLDEPLGVMIGNNLFYNNEKNYFVSAVIDEKKQIQLSSEPIELSQTDKQRLHSIEDTQTNLLIKANGDYTQCHMQLDILDGQKNTILDRYNKTKNIPEVLKNLKKKNFLNKYMININEETTSWKLLKERIDNYELEKTKYTKKLSTKLISDDNYTKDDYKKDMALWEKDNENILKKIATDINMIIQKFNLELDINEDTQSYEELIIKDLSNNSIIEYDDLSTGTKNLLSTFIPLKSHKPQDSIILIDEPEMSFYPNIQRELTDLYMKVGENNQLIMATHSPLIASSFEPWEVVELKFNKNNQIYREKYYEGENHVDNYIVDPRILTWTGILTDIFDLTEDSNFSFREKKLMEYATLKAEIKAMEDKTSKDAKEKIQKFKKLSSLLGLQN